MRSLTVAPLCGAQVDPLAARGSGRWMALEHQPQCKLNDTCRFRCVDNPKVSIPERVSRYVEIREVEYVEKFAAKLSLQTFRHSEELCCTEVDIIATGSAQHRSRRVAKLKVRCVLECCSVEVVLQRAP